MKKWMILLTVAVALVMVLPASAQTSPWPEAAGNSGVQVVNMAASGDANVIPTYISEDGTKYPLGSQVLGMGESYTWYAEPQSQASFRGAVMLSSDAPVAAIAKTEWGSGAASGAAAYSGKDAGALEVLLPLLVIEHYGTTSSLTIQNTDMDNAITVDVEYKPQGASSFTRQVNVAAGASTTVDLAFDTDFVDPAPSSTAGWVGAATITSASTPVVAAAHTTSKGSGFVYAYDGFTVLDQTVAYAPLVRRNFASLTTGIQVADAGGSGGTVTVEYVGTEGYGGPAYSYTDSTTLPAGGSVTFYQGSPYFNDDTAGLPDDFLGSAKITATGTQIAVVVNDQTAPEASGKKATASAYSGIFTVDGSATIVSPLARNAFANFSTGIQVQNIGGDTVDVAVAYTTSSLSSNSSTPPTSSETLDPGESVTFYLPLDWGSTAAENGWLGSATFTATGAGEVSVAAITNDQDTVKAAGDTAIFNCPAQ